MTLSEFKAWFEGYTGGLDGAPTEKQFKRIKAKVAEITGTPISYPVFIDRYRYLYRDTGWPQPIVSWSSAGAGTGGVPMNAEWDSHAAMYAVGKADAIAA